MIRTKPADLKANTTRRVRCHATIRPGLESLEQRTLLASLKVIGTPNVTLTATAGATSASKTVSFEPGQDSESHFDVNTGGSTIQFDYKPLSSTDPLTLTASLTNSIYVPGGAISGSMASDSTTFEVVPDSSNENTNLLMFIDVGAMANVEPGLGGSGSADTTVSYSTSEGQQGTLDASAKGATDVSDSKMFAVRYYTPFTLTFGFSGTATANSDSAAPTPNGGVTVALQPGPQIAPSLALAEGGGVDYSYAISNGDLPGPATVDLYWASGTTPATEIGGPIASTQTKKYAGPYGPFHVDAATLGNQPVGAKYLLAVADPDNTLYGADPSKVAVLPLGGIEATPMSFDSSGNVDYGYQITGGDLPEATTIDLYFATGTTTDTELGNPIVVTTTDTAQGTYPLVAAASAIARRPNDATYLLAVVDPGNTLSPANPNKVEPLLLGGIQATTMTLNSDGVLDYGYQITNADLSQSTTVDLYWASGTTPDSEIGSAIVTTATATAQGTYPLQKAASDLGARPDGATYLLAVADPSNALTPADPSKVESLPLAGIEATPMSFGSDGGLVYGYKIKDGDLLDATTVDLYWASGTTPDTEIGDAVTSTATERAQGTYNLAATASDLSNPPAGAAYLLAEADPDNAASDFDSSKVAALLLPNIAATTPSFTKDGGVNYGYTISGTNLPIATTVSLYWASGTTINSELGGPIQSMTTEMIAGAYGLNVSAAAVANAPENAKYLIAVVDQGGTVIESNKSDNAAALAYEKLPPSVVVTSTANTVDMGDSYTVSAEITNNGPVPITVDLHWAEIFPALPVVKGQPGADDVSGIFLAPFASKTIDLGTFTHNFAWLPTANPVKAFEGSVVNVLKDLGKASLKAIIGDATEIIDLLSTIGGFLTNQVGSLPHSTAPIGYQAIVTDGDGHAYDSVPLNIVLHVPLTKQLLYRSSQVVTAAAALQSGAGAAALFLGQVPEAAVLLASEVASLLAASAAYDQAADPPDANYKTLAAAVPIDMSELDALPDGPWKQYAEDWLMLQADQTAEITSQNRADGAAAAGDLVWQSNQLAAASGFASDVATEYAAIQSLYRAVIAPYIQQTILPNVSSIAPYLKANGLPSLEVKYLSQQGWSTDDLNGLLQTLIDTGPADVQSASGLPNTLAISSLTFDYVAQKQMDQAIQIRINHLGKTVLSPTSQQLQSLSSQQTAITAGITAGVLTNALSTSISSYLANVFRAIQTTNNPAAFQDDLHFAQQARTQELSLTPPPANSLFLNPIADQFVPTETTVAFTAFAADSNVGAKLTYTLDPGAPNGAAIDPVSGAFTWQIPAGEVPGQYAVTVRVTDNSKLALHDARMFTIDVFQSVKHVGTPPVVTLRPAGPVVQFGSFVDSGSFTSTATGSFKGTVDYGDGSGAQALALSSSGTFALSHVYTRSGTFSVTVNVTDSSGRVGSQVLSVVVNAAPLVSGYGPGRDAFVTKLYTENLGRLPTPGGLQYWSRFLFRGVRPIAVAKTIYRSPEHHITLSLGRVPRITFSKSYLDALRAGKAAARAHGIRP